MLDRKILLTLLLTMFLAACGGSGGGGGVPDPGGDTGNGTDTGDDDDDTNGDDTNGDDDDGTDAPATKTGVFVDSIVAGIGYRTATHEGATNAEGEFSYEAGETVVFFIGDIELPPVTATELLTPLDVFATEDFDNQQVINFARLLQSLDQDSDLDNGIQITAAAASAATGLALDFNVPTATFEADAEVINLVSNGGGAGTLVSAEDALAHLEQLSVLGSWYLVNADDSIVITLMADGTYLYGEGTTFSPEDPTGTPGLEYGSYTWDPVTKLITADVTFDTTGTWGLSELTGDETVVHEAGVLTYTDPDGDPESGLVLTRAKSDINPLIGGWKLGNPEEGKVISLTFTETHYAHLEYAPASDDVGQPGPEFGTYTWNTETGEFLPVAEINLNGEWGFSDEPAAITMQVDGDTLTLSFEGEAEPAVLSRVK